MVLFGAIASFGQPDTTLITAYDRLLDLRIHDSREMTRVYLDQSNKSLSTAGQYRVSDIAFATYIRSLSDLFHILVLLDPDHYSHYNSFSEKEYLNTLDELDANNPYVAFSKAEIRLHSALIHLNEEKAFSGAIRLIQAYRQSRQNSGKWNNLIMMKKTYGLLQIILSLAPDKYNFLFSILRIHPDFKEGYSQLHEVSRRDGLFRFEASMLLALINSFYLNEYQQADSVINAMKGHHHNSLLFNYLAGVVSIKTGKNESAIRFLESASDLSEKYRSIPLVDYYLGECYLKALDLNKAASKYHTYINRQNPEKFIKDSYFKLYLISLLKSDSARMLEYSALVQEKGSLATEKDKNAQILTENGYIPYPELLRARLMFDGGYYDEAEGILNEIPEAELSKEDKMEMYYRYARMHELTRNLNQAEIYFYRVIHFSGYENHYLVANSHLHLGYIALEGKNYDRAAYFFERALDYNGEIYSNSIKSEAIAGLEQIPED